MQMNAVTQAVASNAEESASASEELSSQSTELSGMVAQFRIGDERPGARGGSVPRRGAVRSERRAPARAAGRGALAGALDEL